MTHPLPTSMGSPLDDRGWKALEERDASARGLYAVVSTGVYCRFGCPSRRPLRKNVLFFEDAAAAQAAGFRACRRCASVEPTAKTVLAMCRYIEAQGGRVPPLEELSQRFEMSPGHLQRTFKARVGVSPRGYADALRVDRLRRRLRGGEPVLRAMVETGYGSTSRLYENTSRTLGMTPRAYRDKAPGVAITYTTVRCPIGGYLLVAATARGLCSVRMGDRADGLVAELREEFAGASLTKGNDEFSQALVAYLRGLGPLPELPLDIRATAFQRRVWEAIRAVPHGETVTYSDVAKVIGAPTAVRAVARACGQNPVALAIPCHRVVAKAGGGGYRWGAARKDQLLRMERAQEGRALRGAAAPREATSGARQNPK